MVWIFGDLGPRDTTHLTEQSRNSQRGRKMQQRRDYCLTKCKFLSVQNTEQRANKVCLGFDFFFPLFFFLLRHRLYICYHLFVKVFENQVFSDFPALLFSLLISCTVWPGHFELSANMILRAFWKIL